METDNSLKLYISTFNRTFAEWLLGNPPQQVRPLNIELLANATRSDLIFEVIEANGQLTLLHIELQGPSSHEPMPWRMLDYMTRLARRELGQTLPDSSVRLHSVVFYVGQGAGVNDTGRYELLGATGRASLTWQYEPLRLWQMEAQELLALGSPTLLALVGQTRLENPKQTIPEVLARIQEVEDKAQQERLLMMLTSLIDDKEILEMVEKILDPLDEYLQELPYQKRIRQQAREEGLAEGRAEGKAEGVLIGLREAILEAIILRFDPAASEYRRVSRQLENLTSQEGLQRLHAAAIQAESMAAFVAQLTEELSIHTDKEARND